MSSLDTAEEQLSTQTASTAFQLAWGAISKLGKKAWDRATLDRAMKRYAQGFLSRHGRVKVLGMANPIPLAVIYTAVEVVSPNYRIAYSGIEGISQSLRERKRESLYKSKPTPGIVIANKEQFLNILGSPGAGKSTFLKRIGLEALLPRKTNAIETDATDLTSGNYTPECFPVYIELRKFKNEPVDLFQALVQEFEACGLPDSAAFVTLCLSEGRLLLLLDGVDELPTDKLDAAIQNISDFADKYEQNRFITSCRTAFYKTFFRRFVDVELTAFDDGQIKTFINNWFSSELDRESKSAETFLSLLFSTEHRSTLELARTPLLLTFLSLVFDDSQKFPANRSSLYRRALMILMEKWAAEKRVHNSPVYADLHVELEMELLSEIAAKAYIEDQILFSEQYLVQSIAGFMHATLNAPRGLDARKILDAIQVQQGLLVERAADAYSFSHLTIQEYLTAEYFHRPAKLRELVEEHLFDEKWREVFLLSAGMAGADDLLLCMLDVCQSALNTDETAQRCLKWTLEVAPNTGDAMKDAAWRIYLLSIPLRFKRYTEGRYERSEKGADDLLDAFHPNFLRGKRGPMNWSVRSAKKWLGYFNKHLRRELPLAKIETELNEVKEELGSLGKSPGNRYKYPRRINGIVCGGLGLSYDLHGVSRAKGRTLLSVLYGLKLIVDCKNSALRLSTSTWQEFVGRLITLEPNAQAPRKVQRISSKRKIYYGNNARMKPS